MSINMQILNTKLHICTTGQECIRFWSEAWDMCIVLASKIRLLWHCLLQVVVSQTFEIKVLAALNHCGIRLNQLRKKIIFYYLEFYEIMSRMMYLLRPHAHLLGLPQQHSVASEQPSVSWDSHAEGGKHGSHGSYTLPGPGRSLIHDHWKQKGMQVDSKSVDGFIYIAAFVYAASYVHN